MYGCSMLHAQHWLAPALVVTSVGRDVFMPCRTPPEITALLNLSQTKALLNPSLDQSPCSPGFIFHLHLNTTLTAMLPLSCMMA